MKPNRPDNGGVIKARKRPLLGLILIVFTLALGSTVCFGQEKIQVSGITESIKDVTLSLAVSGTVKTVFFKEGDYVRKGQTILTLDRTLETLEVERRKLIWDSKVEVDSALEQAATLKSILESTRRLFESTKSVSREELEKRELEYKLVLAERRRLEVEEEKQRIEYKMAVENLRRRSLISPLGGVIIDFLLEEGESCEPQQPLVQVIDRNKCLLVCNIEEITGRNLKKGQVVDLEIRAGSGTLGKKGKIIFISPAVDPASGLMEVKTEFDNKDGEVRPGVSGLMLLKAP
ncbi:MAG: efflux RND transporter periplasmic adaptor subunit [Deltaproteobacteria bacterium]|nr:efflux RND transporter periplasmic adaptor subunit [Deltaproteobacteria bacterium]